MHRVDPLVPDQLLGVERQKQALMENTRRFLHGRGANNALLWGSRGTGKSSLIKAMLNAYGDQGLRMIEVDADDLGDLPEIIDPLLDLPQRFVIFCDDLSFEQGDSRYKGLKRVLEGALELPPKNVVVYASSNRRHLLPEQASDNDGARVVDTELHHTDAVEEKISLSDRDQPARIPRDRRLLLPQLERRARRAACRGDPVRPDPWRAQRPGRAAVFQQPGLRR